MSDIGWLAIEKGLELRIGFANTSTNNVFLVLARELTTRDKKIRTVLANRRSGTVAKAAEPDEEILLELRRFLFTQLIVSNESDMDETQRLLEDRLDFSLEDILSRRCVVEVV